MTETKAKPRPKTTKAGRKHGDGLNGESDAIEAGRMAKVNKRSSVRKIETEEPKYIVKNAIVVRLMLGATQEGFAKLIGVSTNTIQAWEQGINPISGIAAKLLVNIRDNIPYWRKQLAKVAKQKKGPESFRQELKCSPVSLSYDFAKHRGVLVMEEGHCCDMGGCIFMFESIDSDVTLIETVSGDQPDTRYVRNGKWEAYLPAK